MRLEHIPNINIHIFGQTRTPNLVISMPASYPLRHRSCMVMNVISSYLNSIKHLTPLVLY